MPEVRYLHGHHSSVLDSHRWRTAANSAAYLRPHLRPGMSLLDLGAGAGTITADLAAIVAPGRVTATEISDDVVEVVRDAMRERRVTTVDTVVADAHDLPFENDTFDVAHAHQVLQHLVDPVQALRELARVTRPGGLVAVRDADYDAMTWYPPSQDLDDWQDLYRELARAGGGEPDAGRRLLSWAHEAGLTDIEAGAETWCFATPADRAWWTGTWSQRVLSSAFADQALAAGTPRADLQRLSDGWRTWGAHPDGWFLIPHGYLLVRI